MIKSLPSMLFKATKRDFFKLNEMEIIVQIKNKKWKKLRETIAQRVIK